MINLDDDVKQTVVTSGCFYWCSLSVTVLQTAAAGHSRKQPKQEPKNDDEMMRQAYDCQIQKHNKHNGDIDFVQVQSCISLQSFLHLCFYQQHLSLICAISAATRW